MVCYALVRWSFCSLPALCLLFATAQATGQDLVGVYLTWKRDPCTTMTVNWVDIYAQSPTNIWYRQVGIEEWASASATLSTVGPSTLQLRRVELTGLAPDTTYEFGIGKIPAKSTDGWRFRTMPAVLTRPVRFVAGGDMMHSRAMVDTMNKQVGRLDPDFALLGGDLAYENGVTATRWIDWLQSWTRLCVGKDRRLIPMVITIGNHEVRGGANGKVPDDAPYFYSLFSLPEDRSYYGLDFGEYLSLVVLDSGHTQKVDGAQAAWLGPALAARARQTFLFACYHLPAYGTTKAPKNGTPLDVPGAVSIRKHWVPHFERYGLTAVFENDHHNFKRSHRIREHRRDDENGVLYLGDGAWGVKTRDVPKPEAAWWLAKAEPRNHVWHVELRPDRTAKTQAIDDQGVVFDETELAQARTRPVAAPTGKPNLVWIMADDLGYGDLGCYGQQVISTPQLDRMAREGLRFTHFYAGATVCAPSRSVLMTGQHHGHTRVRGNAGPANPAAQALRPEDTTVAAVLRHAGYRTALIGKWGLGDEGAAASGLPRKQGFDEFFGYLNQQHAHNHFPDFLWRNEGRVAVPNKVTPVGENGAGYATDARQFADDLFADAALAWVAENQSRPFFLYWSLVIPYANNERTRALKNGAQVPDFGPYAEKDWPDPDKGQAAMISRLDSYVGRLLAALRTQGLAENTLVIFTSDNGPHNESNHSLARFQPSGPLTGIKRSLTDGGIRVPCIAWWPGRVAAGTESAHVAYFGDWMATAAELAGGKPPDGGDSISFAPTLFGKPSDQRNHEFLYWEFHEGGFKQAALYQGRWKGIRSGDPDAPIVLYDQQNDIAEKTNVAARHPDITAVIEKFLSSARSHSPDWEPFWQFPRKSK